MGPDALRLADLQLTLENLGLEVQDSGNLPAQVPTNDAGLSNFTCALQNHTRLKKKVSSSLKAGRTPIVLGGDHSIAIGSISGALDKFGEDVAVLWIDAHADINVPGNSPSGNLHGMILSALVGLPSEAKGEKNAQWKQLLTDVVPAQRLRQRRIGWLGLRDVDSGERECIRSCKESYVATMHDVDRYGLVMCLERLEGWLWASGATKLWISFDVDSLDPILAPGTGTAVRGGLSYREGHLIAELLHEALQREDCPYSLIGMDLVETNPMFDNSNETAKMTVEWVASLFGKSILGPK